MDNLPEEYPDDVCLLGKGEACCSFLMLGPGGLFCGKGSAFQPILEKRRAEKSIRAMGDNCEGPPTFAQPEPS